MAKKDTDTDIEIETEGARVAEKTDSGPRLVRFWSMNERHQIALSSGKNVIFNGHVFLAEDGGRVADEIRKVRASDIREIVDAPFSVESDQAKFNKFLNDVVYSGERGVATRRGVKLLEGLFSTA